MGSLYRFARNRAWDSAQMFLRNLDARHFVYSVQSTALRLWVMSCLVGVVLSCWSVEMVFFGQSGIFGSTCFDFWVFWRL